MNSEGSGFNRCIRVVINHCRKLDKNQRLLLLVPIIIVLAVNPLLLLGLIGLGMFLWLQKSDFQGK